MVFNASIKFRYDPGDQLPAGSVAGEVYTFSDTYRIDPYYHDQESARAYIDRDLRLVAGGGYVPIPNKNILDLTIRREYATV